MQPLLIRGVDVKRKSSRFTMRRALLISAVMAVAVLYTSQIRISHLATGSVSIQNSAQRLSRCGFKGCTQALKGPRCFPAQNQQQDTYHRDHSLVSHAAIFGDGGAYERQNPGEKPEPVENPLDNLSGAQRSSIDVDGVSWSYLRTEGGDESKPTIVCAHGILSSSYTYGDTLKLLQRDGYDAVAFDWPGFGQSSKPSESNFGYKSEDYTKGLKSFVDAIGIKKPFVFITQGYILGQYGILFAAENPDLVEKLVILNTPLGAKSKLPAPLSSYTGMFKNFAFGKNPDAGMYHAAGGPYAFNYTDYQNLQMPYESSEDARLSFETVMKDLNFEQLLSKVSMAAERFRNPTLIPWGTDDKYLALDQVLSWLETKPTSTKLFALPASMGHYPQLDFPEQLIETVTRFINDEDYTKPSNVKGASSDGGGPPADF
mmetsp:Transcript_37709/g.63380  ORF Transcript_37709/g.63380 Transcript_37709/m.63380 type:complete len:430 (+) Transcript_37709:3-1292(+)